MQVRTPACSPFSFCFALSGLPAGRLPAARSAPRLRQLHRQHVRRQHGYTFAVAMTNIIRLGFYDRLD